MKKQTTMVNCLDLMNNKPTVSNRRKLLLALEKIALYANITITIIKYRITRMEQKMEEYLIRNSKIFDCIPTNIAFRHSPKSISILHYNYNQSPIMIPKKKKNFLETFKKAKEKELKNYKIHRLKQEHKRNL